tara:strand:- start:853 stop:1185 length:333 start_codon:yes stop_codon:yes gene_type:complete
MDVTITCCFKKCIKKKKPVSIPARTNKKRKYIHKYIINLCKIYNVNIIHRSVWYGTNFVKGKNHNAVEIIPEQILIQVIFDITKIPNPIISLLLDYQTFGKSKKLLKNPQ